MPINISINTNTIAVQENINHISVNDSNNPNIVDITQPVTNILEIITSGPQGPIGPSGSAGIIPNTGSFITTSSFNAYTGSTTSQFAGTASYATNALTASYLSGYVSPFPYTGSAQITGSLGITGSLNVTGSITGSLFGTSSYSTQATSASYATQAVSASFATSSSFATQAASASFATTSSFVPNTFLQNGNSFGTTATLGTNDNQSLALETSGSTKMFISSSGNVGIGTTSPSKKLDVAGDALINGLTIGTGGGNISNNTANGVSALFSNTTGENNTANGFQALYSNTTGNNNTANGLNALFNNTTGENNTANGSYALVSNTTGENNTANGFQALYSNTTGFYNTANGVQALYYNTTGDNNTANGLQALYNNTTGDNNTANGVSALQNNTTIISNYVDDYYTDCEEFPNDGYYQIQLSEEPNITFGVQVTNGSIYSVSLINPPTDQTIEGGYAISGQDIGTYEGCNLYINVVSDILTGENNTANGVYALYNNTIGNSNTANGLQALYNNTTGNNNTANGVSALYNNTTGTQNTANGFQALFSNTTGTNNTSNGVNALLYNTTGTQNTANGLQALFNNTTGEQNTANGVQALYSNTTGYQNTANGVYALLNNTTGTQNTANGVSALLSNTTGEQNTANGLQALYSNTTGTQNTANGLNALLLNTTGNSNTANGVSALYSNTTGTNNIGLGTSSQTLNSSDNNSIVIGDNATGLGSNTVVLGNNSIVTTALKGSVGIGTTTLNPSALLEISSSTKGFLPPRMTTTQRDAISTPATGLVLYNTTLNTTDTFDGTSWQRFGQQTLIKGSGTTSATTSLLVQNSAGSNVLKIDDAGSATFIGNIGLFNFSSYYQFNAGGGYLSGTYLSGAAFSTNGPITANVTGAANASAMMQADSTTRGFLPPRMTTTQRDAIATPATGLQVYNTTTNLPSFYNGTTWGTLAPSAAPVFTTSAQTPLIIGGTSTTQTLTYKTTTGVGATGADHIFQVGNNGATEAMRILNNSNVGIGTNAPASKLDVYGAINTNAGNGVIALNLIGSTSSIQATPSNGTSKISLTSQSSNVFLSTTANSYADLRQTGAVQHLRIGAAAGNYGGNLYSYIGDSSNGFYWNTINTASTEVTRMLLSSTGNLLINTTTDNGGKLQIKAPGALSTDIALRVRNSADTSDLMTVQGDGYITANNTIQTTAGGMQIFGNSSSWGTTNATALQLASLSGTSYVTSYNNSSSQFQNLILRFSNLTFASAGGNFNSQFFANGNLAINSTTDNGGKLQIKAPGALSTDIALRVRNSADTSDLMTVQGDGMSLIRGNSTEVYLNSNSTLNGVGRFIVLNSYASSTNFGLMLKAGTQETARFTTDDGSGNLIIQNSWGSYGMAFNTAGANTRMFINGAGQIGIGTNAPTARVHIKGSGTTLATTSLLVQNSVEVVGFTVLDNGYVGIGKIPVVALDVVGDILITNSGSTSRITINTSTSLWALVNTDASGIFSLRNNSTGWQPWVANNSTQVLSLLGSIGINQVSPNASSALDVTSTTKGFLPPRMTTTQKNAIASPAAGLEVFDTTLNVPSFYNGTAWGSFAPTTSPVFVTEITTPHLIGGGSAPTYTAGAGAGASPTISISATDLGGYITVTTGTLPTLSAIVVTVNFATTYGTAPKAIILSPAGVNAAALSGAGMVYVDQSSITATSFPITVGSTPLLAATTYKFYFIVIK